MSGTNKILDFAKRESEMALAGHTTVQLLNAKREKTPFSVREAAIGIHKHIMSRLNLPEPVKKRLILIVERRERLNNFLGASLNGGKVPREIAMLVLRELVRYNNTPRVLEKFPKLYAGRKDRSGASAAFARELMRLQSDKSEETVSLNPRVFKLFDLFNAAEITSLLGSELEFYGAQMEKAKDAIKRFGE